MANLTKANKLEWKDVPSGSRTTKEDWAKLIKKRNSTFPTHVTGFKDKDPRYEENQVTITLAVAEDGKLGCKEKNCRAPSFGDKATPRAEFSAFKHVAACTTHRAFLPPPARPMALL